MFSIFFPLVCGVHFRTLCWRYGEDVPAMFCISSFERFGWEADTCVSRPNEKERGAGVKKRNSPINWGFLHLWFYSTHGPYGKPD